MKMIIHKYKDGTTVSVVWFEPFDGEWPFGDLDEKIVEHDVNWEYDNN